MHLSSNVPMSPAGFVRRLFRWSHAPARARQGEHESSLGILPLRGEFRGLDYRAVVRLWQCERGQAHKRLQRLLSGEASAADGKGDAPRKFGRWLDIVQVPASSESILKDLRMWHQVWRRAGLQLIAMLEKGQRADVEDAFRKQSGPFFYAQGKIDRCIAQLWGLEPLRRRRGQVPSLPPGLKR